MARILVLEPFGGGSHASLYRGWSRHSQHEFILLELPAFHWKWRSRHASWTLAIETQQLAEVERIDVVFCSEMLNLAEWRGFVGMPLADKPCVVYFHENQFTYPIPAGQHRDYHFAYTNILNAVAASASWFNSAFHRDEFSCAAQAWLSRMPDYHHLPDLEVALQHALVLPPGIEPAAVAPVVASSRSAVPTLGWVSRWEFDKRPDKFLAALRALRQRGVEFELILLGQQFARTPAELAKICQEFASCIRHCGYADDKAEYWQWLRQMDVVLSTADHEFFGIGVVEAIHAGARPVLPRKLAYPEVLQLSQEPRRERFFYDSENEGSLVDRLAQALEERDLNPPPLDMGAFCWVELAKKYDDAINHVIAKTAPK